MAKLQIPQKIRTEDFPEEQQEIVDRIGGVYNSFAEEVYRALDKGIDFDNLSRQVVSYNVKIGSTGAPINPAPIKVNLVNRIKGVYVLNAVNVNSPNTYPTAAPFVSWSITSTGQLSVLNVSGLQNNSEYNLTLEIVT